MRPDRRVRQNDDGRLQIRALGVANPSAPLSNNWAGVVTVSGEATTAEVRFAVPEPDANYALGGMLTFPPSGNARPGSARVLPDVRRSSAGFQFTLAEAPGPDASVTLARSSLEADSIPTRRATALHRGCAGPGVTSPASTAAASCSDMAAELLLNERAEKLGVTRLLRALEHLGMRRREEFSHLGVERREPACCRAPASAASRTPCSPSGPGSWRPAPRPKRGRWPWCEER